VEIEIKVLNKRPGLLLLTGIIMFFQIHLINFHGQVILMVIIYSFCSVFISNFSLACHSDIAVINVVCSSPCKFNEIL